MFNGRFLSRNSWRSERRVDSGYEQAVQRKKRQDVLSLLSNVMFGSVDNRRDPCLGLLSRDEGGVVARRRVGHGHGPSDKEEEETKRRMER